MRQRGRFAGFSIYVSNDEKIDNANRCYRSGPDLPPLNFTTECIGISRFVIYYNERLHDRYPAGFETTNVHTELCEVSVQGILTYI